MNKDIKYITENYIESEELCRTAKISNHTLEQLIKEKLIPNFSYQIENKSIISSPLGDEEVVINIKKYFPRSVLELIDKNMNAANAHGFKLKMKNEFVQTFINDKNNIFAYDNIIQEDGSVDYEKLDHAFEIEWNHYLNGIYGICTLNATGAEIAKKEIAVKKLISFIENINESTTDDDIKKELIRLNAQYNEVSNLFSPYQRDKSSRGKYLDKMLVKYSLSELIKNYS